MIDSRSGRCSFVHQSFNASSSVVVVSTSPQMTRSPLPSKNDADAAAICHLRNLASDLRIFNNGVQLNKAFDGFVCHDPSPLHPGHQAEQQASKGCMRLKASHKEWEVEIDRSDKILVALLLRDRSSRTQLERVGGIEYAH